MTTMFECPDCRRHHDEPGEAAFALAVRCFECVWLEERRTPVATVPIRARAA